MTQPQIVAREGLIAQCQTLVRTLHGRILTVQPSRSWLVEREPTVEFTLDEARVIRDRLQVLLDGLMELRQTVAGTTGPFMARTVLRRLT